MTLVSAYHWWEGFLAGSAGALAIVLMPLHRVRWAGATGGAHVLVLLGSVLAPGRRSARFVGAGIHVLAGSLFGVGYAAVWWAGSLALFTIHPAWLIGLVLGAIHGLIVAMLVSTVEQVAGPAGGTPSGDARARGAHAPGTRTGSAPAGTRAGRLQPARARSTAPAPAGPGGAVPAQAAWSLTAAHLAYGVVFSVVFAGLV